MKPSQVMYVVKFGPTVLNFGYDIFLLVPFLGHPVCVQHRFFYEIIYGGFSLIHKTTPSAPPLQLITKVTSTLNALYTNNVQGKSSLPVAPPPLLMLLKKFKILHLSII